MQRLLSFALFTTLAVPLGAQSSTPSFGATVPADWAVDRYAPEVFGLTNYEGRTDVLQIGIGADDRADQRPSSFSGSFYNTQGMQYDVNVTGSWRLEADLFINAAWLNPQNGYVRTDMWGVASTASDAVAAYPILGFTNYGGPARLQGWDASVGWVDYGAQFTAGAWNTLAIEFDLSSGFFSYFANGSLLSTVQAPANTAGLTALIMQGYNFDLSQNPTGNPDYAAYWSNTESPEVVPEPATMTLLATGLAGMAAARRRRKAIAS